MIPKATVFDIETAPVPGREMVGYRPMAGDVLPGADAEHREVYAESATLDAGRSYIQAIGFKRDARTPVGIFKTLSPEGEAQVLRDFWGVVAGRPLAGWNIYGFDLPFLFRRSLLHRICPTVPLCYPVEGCGAVDLMLEFSLTGERVSLATAAECLGISGKLPTGTFTTPAGRTRKRLPHELNAADPDMFDAYLRRDVTVEAEIYQRLFFT